MIARGLFGVCDAAARCHHVHATRTEEPLKAEAVVVNHLAVDQPRHRLEPDVRMWCHVHWFPLVERERAESIEKTPGAHHAPIVHG